MGDAGQHRRRHRNAREELTRRARARRSGRGEGIAGHVRELEPAVDAGERGGPGLTHGRHAPVGSLAQPDVDVMLVVRYEHDGRLAFIFEHDDPPAQTMTPWDGRSKRKRTGSGTHRFGREKNDKHTN